MSIFITDAITDCEHAAGCFRLSYRNLATGQTVCCAYTTVAKLAFVLYDTVLSYGQAAMHHQVAAVSPRGRALAIEELAVYGKRLYCQRRLLLRASVNTFVYRQGPVPGIHRRSSRGYFRSIRTTNERRLAMVLAPGDGEIGPRAARNFSNIATGWDDESFPSKLRSWKAQGKRRKAWDR